MKTGHLEICMRMEDLLQRKISHQYSITIAETDEAYERFEKTGFAYDMITIRFEDNVYSTKENAEEFWEIIKKIEKRRKIRTIYDRYYASISKSSPELFEEELVFHDWLLLEYILIIAVMAMIFAIFFFYFKN